MPLGLYLLRFEIWSHGVALFLFAGIPRKLKLCVYLHFFLIYRIPINEIPTIRTMQSFSIFHAPYFCVAKSWKQNRIKSPALLASNTTGVKATQLRLSWQPSLKTLVTLKPCLRVDVWHFIACFRFHEVYHRHWSFRTFYQNLLFKKKRFCL